MTNGLVPKQELSAIVSDIYKDVLQPSARRIGYSLETITKVALSPVAILEWGFEHSKDWLRKRIEERLADTPREYIIEPTANIAFTALSHIARSTDTPELREIYAELLLKSMDSRTSSSVHPAYFSIVEQLAPEEAVVLGALHGLRKEELFSEKAALDGYGIDAGPSIEKQFTTFCASALGRAPDNSEVWIVNLCRLGILVLQASSEAVFRPEEADNHGVREASVQNYQHRWLSFTAFGRAFIVACVPAV